MKRLLLFESWVESQMNEEMALPQELMGIDTETAEIVKQMDVDAMCPMPGKPVDVPFVAKKFQSALEKGMGGPEKYKEFVDKLNEMLSKMEKGQLTELLKTLKGYLKKPKEGAAYVQELVMGTKESQMNEADMMLIFFLGQLVIAIVCTLIKLGAFGKVATAIGCQRRF